MEKIPITIVGGGVVGCAIAFELSKKGIEDIVLLEKNKRFGEEQSARSAGVVHSGIYYKPGSLMSKLCVEGVPLLYEFCQSHNVPIKRTGKLVAATNPQESKTLEKYFERSQCNGTPGVKHISGKDAKRIEPNIKVDSALYSPTTGIIEASDYIRALISSTQAVEKPVNLLRGTRVIGIEPKGDYFSVTVQDNNQTYSFDTEVLINSAGLYSLNIAKMVNPHICQITGSDKLLNTEFLKGDFYEFNQNKRPELRVSTNIYPTPKKVITESGHEIELWGAHLTPTFELDNAYNSIDGKMIRVGPRFKPTNDPLDFNSNCFSAEEMFDAVHEYFPGLKVSDLKPAYSGILGILSNHPDFYVKRDQNHPNCIQLLGMESPALTSSLAIAKYVANLVENK